MKILIVDDARENHEILKMWLSSLGVDKSDIDSAYSGEHAVAAVAYGKVYDLIVMDNQMPGGIFGEDATLQIRDIEERQQLQKSIIVTFSGSYQGVYSKANTAISKPTSKRELKDLLELMRNNLQLLRDGPAEPLEMLKEKAKVAQMTSKISEERVEGAAAAPKTTSPLTAQRSPSAMGRSFARSPLTVLQEDAKRSPSPLSSPRRSALMQHSFLSVRPGDIAPRDDTHSPLFGC